jgi:hypothetical protein
MLRAPASKHDVVLWMRGPKPRPPYEEVWHIWTVLIPRRSITNRLLWGTVLRRRDDDRWIYKEYPGSIEATQYHARSSENIERPLHSRSF